MDEKDMLEISKSEIKRLELENENLKLRIKLREMENPVRLIIDDFRTPKKGNKHSFEGKKK